MRYCTCCKSGPHEREGMEISRGFGCRGPMPSLISHRRRRAEGSALAIRFTGCVLQSYNVGETTLLPARLRCNELKYGESRQRHYDFSHANYLYSSRTPGRKSGQDKLPTISCMQGSVIRLTVLGKCLFTLPLTAWSGRLRPVVHRARGSGWCLKSHCRYPRIPR